MVQSAIGKRATILDFPGGCLVIRYKGDDQPYRTFDKIRQVKQMAIIENAVFCPFVNFVRILLTP